MPDNHKTNCSKTAKLLFLSKCRDFACSLLCLFAAVMFVSCGRSNSAVTPNGDSSVQVDTNSSVISTSDDSGDTASAVTESTHSDVTETTAAAVTSKKTAATSAAQPTVKTTSTTKATTAGSNSSGSTNPDQVSKPLWIQVSIAKQNVTVYDANNRVVESFICSTGLPGSDTPKGTYKIQQRGYSFFSNTYQEGAYYWTQFSGDFLFHSVPFDKNKDFIAAEAAKLGTEASHGCVRLSLENAKWIYDNIPKGTKVVIE